MTWMETERAALVDTFRDADPDADTLCEGWTVRHLLAHLVLREHRPVRNAVELAARRPPGREVFLGSLVERARTPAGYAALLQRFAGGMSAANPVSWPGDGAHLLEYVIHHEDVRRGGDEPAEPRVLPPDEVRAIWARLAPFAKLGYRRSPVGVVLAVPGGPRAVVRRAADAVVLTGDPVELALHASGRRTAADVEVMGRPKTVERFLDHFAGDPDPQPGQGSARIR
ncbi:TIGR03085 family protein [Georgenia yuyongxinii]|uniref:TIGR03085 family protein n=1 Tax=Georgenia yuyongxinii TaxID=2589797 RepID=A0A5B8C351_9MICO|nr:TIGR03085 family metal-binding protein [Georgenia yuyongxinii]QDC24480.1 TIGR03085 family protein [Georgenia yuyongxinii]